MRVWIDTAAAAAAPALFGLPPVTRLERSLAKLGTAAVTLSPGGEPAGRRLKQALLAAEGPMVAVDGATLVDPRLLGFLAKGGEAALAFHGEGAERAAAARLTPEQAALIDENAATLLAVCDGLLAQGVPVLASDAMPGFIANLRRSMDYWIFAVPDEAARHRRERWMFLMNYKGSTDALTRWVYPPVVWQLTRLATRWHIHPNWITLVSIFCTFGAVPLFAHGHFLAGFVLAFAMSILDSVDGKVARLTLTDSPIGNVLDHGLDIVHPPLWYGAWAFGLGGQALGDAPVDLAAWLIGFYVADRLILGVAKARFKRGLHAMTPLDGAVRTFIARRNINLVIFGAFLLAGHGLAGLAAVTAWQGLTFAWHTLRTITLKPLPR